MVINQLNLLFLWIMSNRWLIRWLIQIVINSSRSPWQFETPRHIARRPTFLTPPNGLYWILITNVKKSLFPSTYLCPPLKRVWCNKRTVTTHSCSLITSGNKICPICNHFLSIILAILAETEISSNCLHVFSLRFSC